MAVGLMDEVPGLVLLLASCVQLGEWLASLRLNFFLLKWPDGLLPHKVPERMTELA